MMDPATKFWSDILTAIVEIESFTADVSTLNDYKRDLLRKRAVERNLSIIGEAMNHLRKLGPEQLPDAAASIVAMRNRLIHSYDNVDDLIVWKVVREHLPVLKTIAVAHLPTD